ncbi:hypothetical protein SBADM41S_10515 [Streptomyces badius]
MAPEPRPGAADGGGFRGRRRRRPPDGPAPPGRPVDQHLPRRQHGDGRGEFGDHLDMVLDQDDRDGRRQRADDAEQPADVAVGQPGCGLVQEQQPGAARQRGGEIEHAAPAVRERGGGPVGEVREPDRLQVAARGLLVQPVPGRSAPRPPTPRMVRPARQDDVFQHRQLPDDRRLLETAGDTETAPLRRGLTRDVDAVEKAIVPWSGRSVPAMRLSRVVLPAPLGPMTACRAPGDSLRLTSSTAVACRTCG